MALEKQLLEVVEITEDDISLKIEVAPEDYSSIYTLQLFKKKYNKETEKWEEDAETTERYETNLKLIEGYDEEDAKLQLFVLEDFGKAYISEPKTFERPEKPLAKFDGKLWRDCTIKGIHDSAKGREVLVLHKDKLYSFAFNTGKWIAKKKMFISNKALLAKGKERFNKLFEDVVKDAWDNTDKLIGTYVDCKVNKNALDQTSDFGWLEPIAPDEPRYNMEYLSSLPKDESDGIADEDIPF